MKLLRKPAVCERTGYCGMQIDRLEAAGKFPKRIKLNPEVGNRSAVAWVESEVNAWIEARAAERAVA